jgi:hypothetical protein
MTMTIQLLPPLSKTQLPAVLLLTKTSAISQFAWSVILTGEIWIVTMAIAGVAVS